MGVSSVSDYIFSKIATTKSPLLYLTAKIKDVSSS